MTPGYTTLYGTKKGWSCSISLHFPIIKFLYFPHVSKSFKLLLTVTVPVMFFLFRVATHLDRKKIP